MENFWDLVALYKENWYLMFTWHQKMHKKEKEIMGERKLAEIASQAEIEDALQDFLGESNLTRALNYVIILLSNTFKMEMGKHKGINSISAEDIVQNVCRSITDPEGRKWNKKKYPRFNKFFFSALKSEVSNTLKLNLNKELQKAPTEKENESGVIRIIEIPVSDYPAGEHDENSIRILWPKLQADLYALGAEPNEILLFEAYYLDDMKRKDIARLLNVSPTEITVIKKRLDRKIIQLRPKWAQYR